MILSIPAGRVHAFWPWHNATSAPAAGAPQRSGLSGEHALVQRVVGIVGKERED